MNARLKVSHFNAFVGKPWKLYGTSPPSAPNSSCSMRLGMSIQRTPNSQGEGGDVPISMIVGFICQSTPYVAPAYSPKYIVAVVEGLLLSDTVIQNSQE